MTSPNPLLQNVQTIVELERQAVHQRSPLDRFADIVTAFAGSRVFIVGHVVWFTSWLILNRGPLAFDPFPFSLLNVMVSIEAIFLTTFVLMTQNRMAKHADRRAHLDLQVNLLAEQELTTILRIVTTLSQQLGVDVPKEAGAVRELLEQTDIHTLSDALDRELPDPASTPAPSSKPGPRRPSPRRS